MARVLVVLAGVGWAFVAFLLALWVTFPGTAVAERIEWEVSDASKGAYALDLGDVGPWWLGLATDSVKVYTRPSSGEPATQLVAFASDARVATGLTSLLRRQPRVSGSVTVGEAAELDFVVGTAMAPDGKRLLVNEVQLLGDAVPLADLLLLVPGAQMDGTGGVDVDVQLAAAEGFSKANGTVRIGGKDVQLVQPVIMDFPLGRDVAIRELDIELEARDGKARVARGRLGSDVANVDISGDIVLADEIGRSRVDVRVELTLDASMKMLEGMLASAAKDGKFVYRCVGQLDRIATSCRADGERKTAAVRPSRATRGTLSPTPAEGNVPLSDEVRAEMGTVGGMNEEEREKRRAELQERLRKRREQREAERGGARRPGELDVVPSDEEPAGDPEELPEEELPPEDEIPLDEELPPEDEGFDE